MTMPTTKHLDLALAELGKTAADIPAIELMCAEGQGNMDLLSAIQDMVLRTLGFEMVITPMTPQVMISNAVTGQYDLWLGGNGIGDPDALNAFVNSYYTPNASPLRGYSNPEFDKLFEYAISAPTLEERYERYIAVEKFFCDEVLLMLFGWNKSYYMYDEDKYTGLYGSNFVFADYTEEYIAGLK